MTTPITRRTVLASVAAAGVLTTAGMSPAEASSRRPPHRPGTPVKLTIMGTTDLHGCVFNWDYFKNTEYNDSTANDIGLAKVATLVEAVRAQRGRENTLMIDAGDTIQGTPLAYYFARIAPITNGHVHPMAAAMNHIGYDAAALGNHEFNYGIPLLHAFADQLDFPLLGANALDTATGLPAFRPYVIKTVEVEGEEPIKGRHPGPDQPRHRHLGQGQRRGQDDFPGSGRAGQDLGAPDARLWRRRRRGGRALGSYDIVLVWRRAALPRERRNPCGATGSGY